MNFTVIIYALLITLGLLGIGSRFIPGSKPDNKVEEIIEKVIEYKTNIKVDLSPDTPDPDDIQRLTKKKRIVRKVVKE